MMLDSVVKMKAITNTIKTVIMILQVEHLVFISMTDTEKNYKK